MISYGRQSIDQTDIDAVVAVLQGDTLTQGLHIEAFEKALCDYAGARYAVVVNSGSAALYLAYRALGLGVGKRLWTSPITFMATANAALMLGAEVSYIDVDPQTGNMDCSALRSALANAERLGCLPDVVVPVHLGGRSCDMVEIRRLSVQYGFKVVEDACHALGGENVAGSKIGACEFSDAAAFSFHPVKSITTGEGGALLTNDLETATLARELRHHGICRDISRFRHPISASVPYEQHHIGFNFRLTDMQAALGISQLKRLDAFIKERRYLVGLYRQTLEGKLAHVDLPQPDNGSAWHLFAIRLSTTAYRERLWAAFAEAGYRLAVHYPPVYTLGVHNLPGTDCLPNAESYSSCTVSLPLYVGLTDAQIEEVAGLLIRFDNSGFQ